MSNFAYLITKKNKPLTTSFIEKFSSLNISISYEQDWMIYFFSNFAEKCKYENGFFKGYFIDHVRKRVGFSQSQDMHKEYYEGCFINIEEHPQKNSCDVHTDVFGLMPLLYSTDKNIVMASDSLYFLKKIRDNLGLQSNFNHDNFVAKTYISALTSHPMSSSTLVNEIKYALPGTLIKIQLNDEMKVNVTHEGAKNIFKLDNLSYEESIKRSAHQLCGSLGGIVKSGMLPCYFDLSGGLDSRLVLAAASPFFGSDTVRVGSRKKNIKDYEIAKKICKTFNLPLNKYDEGCQIKIDPGAIWLASNAGFTDTLYAFEARRTKNYKFNVGGHGAEVFKGGYGWRNISNLIKDYENKDVLAYTYNELKRGLEEFGIDPDDSIGSEWHYLAFRNPVHASRGTQISTLYLRPLMLKSLVHNMKVERKTNSYKVNPISDMLIYINPELAKIDYDDKRKNITKDDLDRVAKTIGRYDPGSNLYDVEPSINLPSEGYMSELLDMAIEDGFCEKISRENCGLYINNTTLPKNELFKYSTNYLIENIFNPENSKFTTVQINMAVSRLLSLNLF